ncbi:uncharacterized protein B0H18DRAFT_1007732 [Fomitopsis serialis]|uniref:uncharacterized protein n=1 Tax=Fomitopsis serialis TaxID=139415 RepID=UPI0020088FD0|nr:uncharacterized protein B0H18DRAFT_1007732 [Neoantrodia serialis]KAH9926061.1 hypothetical protein B0H18DRAFT_1007732 [Neoantrodia serialis]
MTVRTTHRGFRTFTNIPAYYRYDTMNTGLPFSGQPVGFILAGLPLPPPPYASRTVLMEQANELRIIAQACMDQIEVLRKKLERKRKREDLARKEEARLAQEGLVSLEEQTASRTARKEAKRKQQVVAANSRLIGKQPRGGTTAHSLRKLEDAGAAAAGRKEVASAGHRATDVTQQGRPRPRRKVAIPAAPDDTETDGQASMASHAAADGTATIFSSDGCTVPGPLPGTAREPVPARLSGLATVHDSAQPRLEQGHCASGSRMPDERPKATASAQAEPPVVRSEKPVLRRNPPRKGRSMSVADSHPP